MKAPPDDPADRRWIVSTISDLQKERDRARQRIRDLRKALGALILLEPSKPDLGWNAGLDELDRFLKSFGERMNSDRPTRLQLPAGALLEARAVWLASGPAEVQNLPSKAPD